MSEGSIIKIQKLIDENFRLKIESAKLNKDLNNALNLIDEKDQRIAELEEKIDFIFSELGKAFKRKG